MVLAIKIISYDKMNESKFVFSLAPPSLLSYIKVDTLIVING